MPDKILYLIPSAIGKVEDSLTLPFVKELFLHHRHFVVETAKNARRFIKAVQPEVQLRDFQLFELGKKVDEQALSAWLQAGPEVLGLLSDAGSPCIADPGAWAVSAAHDLDIKVQPLPGASSILMALSASGFNGQAFCFHGYIPIDKKERQVFLQHLEEEVSRSGATQLFMETPYRNQQVLQELKHYLKPQTQLHVSAGLLSNQSFVWTGQVSHFPLKQVDLHKVPALFAIGRKPGH